MATKMSASKIFKEIKESLESLALDMNNYEEICEENIKLKKELENKTNQYNIMEKEMTQQRDELNNMSKVSMIQSINKQLEEKNNYIKILEFQLDKLRSKNKIELLPEPSCEVSNKSKAQVVIATLSDNESYSFDPEQFEELNGYELLVYKKNYYLRDLETDELYSILYNKPDKIVGLINNKGKVKLQ
jgi:hypothetical protein